MAEKIDRREQDKVHVPETHVWIFYQVPSRRVRVAFKVKNFKAKYGAAKIKLAQQNHNVRDNGFLRY